jgi:hypothetical protein
VLANVLVTVVAAVTGLTRRCARLIARPSEDLLQRHANAIGDLECGLERRRVLFCSMAITVWRVMPLR